ncbi:MAG: hypothetical protein U0412_04210 [Nitrospira sp.]
MACSPRLSSPVVSVSSDSVHDDPARDAQLSLLREAHRAFAQERYPAAVLFFRRYVETASPGVPRLAEAQWWLGRAYEQTGDYRSAIAAYRIVASGETGTDPALRQYQLHALNRLDQLRQVPGGPQTSINRQVAVSIILSDLPAGSDRDGWFQSLVAAGVTTIVLEPSSKDAPDDAGGDRVAAFTRSAHQAGLLVWSSLDLHQGRGFAVRPEWRVRISDRSEAAVNGIPVLDILHSGYQAAIDARIKSLLQSGCDGILLRMRNRPGYAREYSDESFQRFVAAFALTLSPSQLFGEDVASSPTIQERDTHYWRWIGWKARETVSLVARVRAVIRRINPAGRLLVEVHGATVSEPLVGLEQYGEDLADLYERAGVDLVLQVDELTGTAVLDQLAQRVRSADRLWMLRMYRDGEGSLLERTRSLGMSLEGTAGRNVVLRAPSRDGFP